MADICTTFMYRLSWNLGASTSWNHQCLCRPVIRLLYFYFTFYIKSGNACYHSVQNLLSSSLLSKRIKIKIHRAIILPVVCVGVNLGHSHWGRNLGWGCLRNSVLRSIFGPKRGKVIGDWKNYIMRNWMMCTAHWIFFGWWKGKKEMGGAYSMCGGKESCL